MLQVIPKWQIEFRYEFKDKYENPIFMYAMNITEATNWFNKLSHGIIRIVEFKITLTGEFDEQKEIK